MLRLRLVACEGPSYRSGAEAGQKRLRRAIILFWEAEESPYRGARGFISEVEEAFLWQRQTAL